MLYIVIPVFNRKKYTYDCLESLRAQSVAHQVIIVDDGSTDGTGEMLATSFPDVIVIRGNGQLYWTAAINLGIRRALAEGADYVMTLNNDTVATPDFLEQMMTGAKAKPDALLGAFDIDIVSKQPYYGGEIIHWAWSKSTYLLDTLNESDYHGLQPVSLFPARGLLIPRKVFDTVGLFAERWLPHYMADYDFTHLALRHGFAVYCNYDARLYTYPEEGGDQKIKRSKSLKNYYNHLFSIKGGGNLKNFTVYTFRNCPPVLIPMSLGIGYMRRLVGYWINK